MLWKVYAIKVLLVAGAVVPLYAEAPSHAWRVVGGICAALLLCTPFREV